MTANIKTIGLRLLAALPHRRLKGLHTVAVSLAKGICCGLLAASLGSHPAFAGEDSAQASRPGHLLPAHEGVAVSKRANFERESASRDARHVADWVVNSGDNRSMPFMIVDKTDAKVFAFNADGQLRGAAPALLGLALGDDAIPGIGDRVLSKIRPEERTTPAGRFVAALGHNSHGKEILWVDYDGALSMHSVVSAKPEERRLQRLATPTPLDNRISYGCINVPAKFFNKAVRPAFTGTNGIVYVLPETRPTGEVFGFSDVEDPA